MITAAQRHGWDVQFCAHLRGACFPAAARQHLFLHLQIILMHLVLQRLCQKVVRSFAQTTDTHQAQSSCQTSSPLIPTPNGVLQYTAQLSKQHHSDLHFFSPINIIFSHSVLKIYVLTYICICIYLSDQFLLMNTLCLKTPTELIICQKNYNGGIPWNALKPIYNLVFVFVHSHTKTLSVPVI